MAGILAVAASSGAQGQARAIRIISGTYGTNCEMPRADTTRNVARQCDGRQTCPYILHKALTGVPSQGCYKHTRDFKDFRVEWQCTDTEFHIATLSGDAGPGSRLVLSCVEETGPGK
ncbi:hypothetical protein A6V36_36685 [Paraburkholderia ginsengiterrae]|uniref:Uncharacterized protein n=2 Tax=Paraburkholderia ginsengiterrae TaxID=1462993 RepID=A0A1A9MZN2_9BURK|nr:hypothetical protein A6V37_36500 [Paraburkholderia ginsengiterrae]OAJ54108.1 hypothetical protein A6V36_36685 [Paraburkholderia ginsengiterrae]